MRVPRGVACSSTDITMCMPIGQPGTCGGAVGWSFASTNVNVKRRRDGRTTSSKTPLIETTSPLGKRCWNRSAPPGRASISHDGTSTPSGANQRAKCSATVQTSNTSSRGTGNSRSSRRSSALPAAGMAPLLPALRVQLLQIDVEAVEARVPEGSIVFRPRGDLCERRGFELAWSRLRFATTADQPGSLQHREVLAHRWAAHVERPRQLLHVRVAGGQSLQDRPPRRVCECGKRSAQRVGCHLTKRLSNRMVTCKQARASSDEFACSLGLDPLPWTPPERWLRWQGWQATRSKRKRAGGSQHGRQ